MVRRKYPSLLVAFLAIVLVLSSTVTAKQHDNLGFPNVKIKNFGQMDERFYRGAQPKESDFQSLADLGIKTVIDLREDPESYEKRDVELLGMHYVNIPMSDKSYPRTEQVTQFMQLVDDPSTGKFFVHCAGGRHRTGVMGAVYRFNHSQWNFNQVYAEMKDYDFYTRWGHGDLKKFVEDYAQNFSRNGSAGVPTAASGNRQH
jgi:protein tyrosine/serine phosphatase